MVIKTFLLYHVSVSLFVFFFSVPFFPSYIELTFICQTDERCKKKEKSKYTFLYYVIHLTQKKKKDKQFVK